MSSKMFTKDIDSSLAIELEVFNLLITCSTKIRNFAMSFVFLISYGIICNCPRFSGGI